MAGCEAQAGPWRSALELDQGMTDAFGHTTVSAVEDLHTKSLVPFAKPEAAMEWTVEDIYGSWKLHGARSTYSKRRRLYRRKLHVTSIGRHALI
jgi:hypothetical protein